MSGDIKKLLESIDSISEQNDFPRQAMDYGTGMKPRAESDHAAKDRSNFESDPRWAEYDKLQSQHQFTQARELMNRMRYEHHMDEDVESVDEAYYDRQMDKSMYSKGVNAFKHYLSTGKKIVPEFSSLDEKTSFEEGWNDSVLKKPKKNMDEDVKWKSFKRWYDESPKDVITRARKADTNFLKNVIEVDPRDLGGAAKLQWMAARKELSRRGIPVAESFIKENAERDGYDAFKKGTKKNPHPKDTKAYKDWYRGYSDSKHDHEDKEVMTKQKTNESMWEDTNTSDPVVICMHKDGHKMYFKEFHSNGNYYWTADKSDARDFDTEEAATDAIRMIKAHDPAVYKMGLVGKTHGEKPYPIYCEPAREIDENFAEPSGASPLTHGIDNLNVEHDMEEDWSADEYNRQKMIDAPKSRQHNPVSEPGEHSFVPRSSKLHELDEEDDEGQDEIIQDLSGSLKGPWPLDNRHENEMEDSPMQADPDSVIDEFYTTMPSKQAGKNPKQVGESVISEKSAPGQEAWIKANKARFVKEYGKKKGIEVLYATAWKRSKKNESVNESNGSIEVGDWVSWSGNDGMNVIKRHGKVLAINGGKVKVESEHIGTKVLPLNKVRLHQKATKKNESIQEGAPEFNWKVWNQGQDDYEKRGGNMSNPYKGTEWAMEWQKGYDAAAQEASVKQTPGRKLAKKAFGRDMVAAVSPGTPIKGNRDMQHFESMFAEAMDNNITMSKESRQINESFDLTDSAETKKIVDGLGSMMKLAGLQSQYQGMTPVVSEDLSATLTMSKCEDGKSMSLTITDQQGDEIGQLLSLAGIQQPQAVAVVSAELTPTDGEAPEQHAAGYEGAYEMVDEDEEYSDRDKEPSGEYGDTHEYSNMPKRDVYDLDTQINKGSDLNAPKGEYAKEFPGDNRMDTAKRDAAFESKLWKEYKGIK
jgi:hypothetical protein